MAKGQAGKADTQLGTTNAAASTYGSNAAGMLPGLQGQAQSLINSQGYDPATLNAITNAGMGGVGAAYGSASDAISKNAARTGNPASVGAEQDALARSKGIASGQEAGNIQIQNADFKNQQRQQGLNLLNSLYGTNVGASNSLYGLGPGTLNARAAGGSWAQNTFAPIAGAITGAGSLALKAAQGGGGGG